VGDGETLWGMVTLAPRTFRARSPLPRAREPPLTRKHIGGNSGRRREGGVVDRRGEGVFDGVADEGADSGAAVDLHRILPF